MNNSTTSEPANSNTKTHPFSRRPVWVLLVVVLLFCAFAPIVSEAYFTCGACGMDRTTRTALSLTLADRQSETDCSRWYRDHIQPHHRHLWVRQPAQAMYSAFGVPIGRSFVAGRADGPVVRFDSRTRMLMYQKSADANRLREAFILLSAWKKEGTPARQRQVAVEQALATWEDSGLAGEWAPNSD